MNSNFSNKTSTPRPQRTLFHLPRIKMMLEYNVAHQTAQMFRMFCDNHYFNLSLRITRHSQRLASIGCSKRRWSRGRIGPCHGPDPGSIPGRRMVSPFAHLQPHTRKMTPFRRACLVLAGTCCYAVGMITYIHHWQRKELLKLKKSS